MDGSMSKKDTEINKPDSGTTESEHKQDPVVLDTENSPTQDSVTNSPTQDSLTQDSPTQDSLTGDSTTHKEEELDADLEKLSSLVKEGLSLTPTPCNMKLTEISFYGVVEYINSGKCKNIVTMVGAGISTSAGIPDFRTPGTGLYFNLQKYNLPYSQAIFEMDYFLENPKPFFLLAKELFPGKFKPTISHYFIKLLVQKNLLRRHYTQNIDSLEHIVGIPDDLLVEAHGTFYTSHCVECHKMYNFEWMKEFILTNEELVPMCTECGGIIKPDITFFGEGLPSNFFKNLKEDFRKCDLLIIMGSSLTVEPFASLCEKVKSNCPRLLINKEKVGINQGLMYETEGNLRDVAWFGECDLGCTLLIELLGWADDLSKLMEESAGTEE